MSVVTRSDFPSLLTEGLQVLFGTEYAKHAKEYTRIFEVRKSMKAYEKGAELTGLGLASVKAEGASILYDKPGQGPETTFNHATYGLGFMVTREAREDNLYRNIAEDNTKALTWSMWTTKEIVHANVLNRATTSGYVGGDGVVLASASHPTVNGTQSNLLTAADLSEASLEDALISIANAKNSRGLPIALRAVRLIAGTGNMFNATRIFSGDLRVGTGDNDVNAIKAMGLVPEVEINHYLDDADAWYLQTNVPNGLVSYQRRALDLEDDSDFDTENKKFKATERYSAGWYDWRALFTSVGA